MAALLLWLYLPLRMFSFLSPSFVSQAAAVVVRKKKKVEVVHGPC